MRAELPDPPAEDHVEEREVAERDRGGREGEPHVTETELADEHPVQHIVGRDREETHERRDARVAQGVERRRQNLDTGVAREADRIAGQRLRRGHRVAGGEAAVLVDEPDHGDAENGQGCRRR